MIFPSVVVAGGKAEATFADIDYSGVDNLPTYTFTGVSLGAEHARRFIVIFTGGSAVSVSGVAATKHNNVFWIALVPTGTSGTIVVTNPSIVTEMQIVVWSVTKLRTAAPVNYYEGTGSIDIPGITGGCVLGAAMGVGPDHIWTGLSESAEIGMESSRRLSAVTHNFTSTATITTTCAASGGGAPMKRIITLR